MLQSVSRATRSFIRSASLYLSETVNLLDSFDRDIEMFAPIFVVCLYRPLKRLLRFSATKVFLVVQVLNC